MLGGQASQGDVLQSLRKIRGERVYQMRPPTAFARIACLLAVALPASLAATPALAWGMAGHSIVAEVAERRLPPQVRQRARELAGGSLASVSGWADTVSALNPSRRRWHFVNIPFTAERFEARRDCEQGPEPGCIVTALDNFIAILGNRRKPLAERREALRYVVHLVADIHQPLHCSDRGDAGGTQFAVTYFGQPTNLHMVWDVGILERASYDWGEHVRTVETLIERESVTATATSSVVDWAGECHALGRTVYPEDNATALGAEYQAKHRPAAERQLARAAVRLARVLRTALGGG